TLLGVNAISDPSGNDSINDRELETQTNIFYVQNRNVNAVQNDQTAGNEGFVSSLNPGTFSRETQTGGGAYFFPVGSSINITRYRPVMLTNTGAASNDEYHTRFINWDADVDNFIRAQNDGLECLTNDTFYHAIDRAVGNDPADITLYYIPAADGNWDGMAHWRTSSSNWNDMSTVSMGTVGTFTTMTRAAWAFATAGFPYLLTQLTPAAPTITCPTFCENTNGNLFTATGGGAGSTYTWTVPANGNIANGQGSDSLYVDWTTGTNNVTVVYQDPGGCQSLPASCSPTVNPNPTAVITTDTTNSGPWASTWNFIGNNGVTGWNWSFGDGNTSTSQNATNNYTGAGTYTVTLTVTDGNGCIDTAQSIVTVLEGILIPNVFSPNGDGTNDEFFIPNSGLKEYKIEIYDRWGVKVFESEAPEIHWDGRSTAGLPCTDGTYYYVLHAVSNTHDYSTTGFLTLIASLKQ
ncbi:MAG TPA: gliding motility-associated C-terminal domain-containing protein, partial [Bacteroidia bacterium]|nr:gliding motility-associated C-terminal domain-containing protein [Bacteroidia bacterium]